VLGAQNAATELRELRKKIHRKMCADIEKLPKQAEYGCEAKQSQAKACTDEILGRAERERAEVAWLIEGPRAMRTELREDVRSLLKTLEDLDELPDALKSRVAQPSPRLLPQGETE
jgi:hypothetical protein